MAKFNDNPTIENEEEKPGKAKNSQKSRTWNTESYKSFYRKTSDAAKNLK